MSNPCQSAELQLAALEKQKVNLSVDVAKDLAGVGSGGKAEVIAQHKEDAAELDKKIAVALVPVETCQGRRDVVVDGAARKGFDALAFDVVVQRFMRANGVRAGQLTILKGGLMVLAHAYTYTAGDATFAHTKPSTLFRIASCSKAFTCAAINQLYAGNSGVMPSTNVFKYLGIATPALGPKQDARVDDITVQHLVDNKGGWNDRPPDTDENPGNGYDPVFDTRGIANKLGLSGPPTKRQIAQFMYGRKLQFAPGKNEAYSNFGYLLLGLVIEKASGMPYIDYVKTKVLKPLGLDQHLFLAPMLSQTKNSLEVHYDDPGAGLSAFHPTKQEQLPAAYGGGGFVTELMDSGGGLLTTATTLALFANNRAAFGLGGRAPGAARSGGMPGTSSLMVSRGDDIDWAYTFNSRSFTKANGMPPLPLDRLGMQLDQLFSTVKIPAPDFQV